MRSLTRNTPDDFHLHVRDGDLMRLAVPHTARRFARAIIMPNVKLPVYATELARQYRARILAAVPTDVSFELLMTLYLTEQTQPAEFTNAKASGIVHGVKWYPAGATTNSHQGVQFMCDTSSRVAGTITPVHLLLNRVALCEGGLRPHHYCLPILRREEHRLAVVGAATSGHPRFFLGTDSAPHSREAKESACGCAGIYTAHAAIELYAEVFDRAGTLDKLEAFASFHGGDFYRLPRNKTRIVLACEAGAVPSSFSFGEDTVIPFRAGENASFRLASDRAMAELP